MTDAERVVLALYGRTRPIYQWIEKYAYGALMDGPQSVVTFIAKCLEQRQSNTLHSQVAGVDVEIRHLDHTTLVTLRSQGDHPSYRLAIPEHELDTAAAALGMWRPHACAKCGRAFE